MTEDRPPVTDEPDVLAAIWYGTHRDRAAIHRAHAVRWCDTRMVVGGSGGPGLRRVDGDCPCRDFLVDMIVAGQRFVDACSGGLRNPAGAVRAHIRTRAAGDWIRRRRLDRGAQARTDRLRNGARARGLPSDFHRALLEFAADEAGSPAPLHGEHHLHLRIAVRCAAEFGGSPADHLDRVAAGLPVVARHCRSEPLVNAGTAAEPEQVTWWERYVERPLGRRPSRTEPLDAADPPDPRRAGVPSDVDDVALHLLAVAASGRPGDPAGALGAGLGELVRAELLPAPAAAALLSDPARVTTAAAELSALARRTGTG